MTRREGLWAGEFRAMASPCEILVDADDGLFARRLVDLAAAEARRIETKFSRYREDSVVHALNTSAGRPLTVDDETADLLDLSASLHTLSGGRFDATSGVLRRAWSFDGSDRLPSRGAVKALLPLVGWERVAWRRPELTLPAGMEIDLGGLGKEYAVDRIAALVAAETGAGVLVNFGGDLRAVGSRRGGKAWEVGLENPEYERQALRNLSLETGALATSGDSRRFLLRDGVRYSHILNPRTGWPVKSAPRSVTVLGPTCLEAGALATLAMLRGRDAETFLAAQDVRWWCER
jgi:thiamine biosynthesis lipoprotein